MDDIYSSRSNMSNFLETRYPESSLSQLFEVPLFCHPDINPHTKFYSSQTAREGRIVYVHIFFCCMCVCLCIFFLNHLSSVAYKAWGLGLVSSQEGSGTERSSSWCFISFCYPLHHLQLSVSLAGTIHSSSISPHPHTIHSPFLSSQFVLDCPNSFHWFYSFQSGLSCSSTYVL